ncbi:hypothetical protein LSUB1_G008879, partial [Lachnellula subtilissima]
MSLKMKTSRPKPTLPDPNPSLFNPHLPFNQVRNIEKKVSESQIANNKPPFLFSGIPSSVASTNIFPLTPTETPMTKEMEEEKAFEEHMRLLSRTEGKQELGEAITVPIFTFPVLEHVRKRLAKETENPFAQYGLLAGVASSFEEITDVKVDAMDADPRLLFNIASPSSTFICGSQGSGKSHTLSCLLENSMFPSVANHLPHPLTGLVFHYDTFISDDGGSPCEAAFLSSNKGVKVRVLCAPTNIATIKLAYSRFKNITIEPLRINQTDLNTKRMLDLMAVTSSNGPVPLYVHTIYRILRVMREEQQKTGNKFDYVLFKKLVEAANLSVDQLRPLQQRLDTLESFMPREQTIAPRLKGKGKWGFSTGNDWTPEHILEKGTSVGRVIALDEAHK